ncbi:hypothetical protein FF1_006386 [Malus domestica]
MIEFGVEARGPKGCGATRCGMATGILGCSKSCTYCSITDASYSVEGGSGLMPRVVREDWVRVNVDGATKLQVKGGGAGVVNRDARGAFMATTTCFLPFVSSALQAELLAIKHGVELAQQLGYQKVQVESDSSQAISIINTCVDRASVVDLLVGDDLHSVASFIASKFISISRNNNGIAHCLAKVVVSSGTHLVWIEEPLSFILDLLIQ